MKNVSQRPRQMWLVRVFVLLLLATCVLVAPLGGPAGVGAAGGPPRLVPAARVTASPPLGGQPGARAAGGPRRPGPARLSTAIPPGTIAYTRNYSDLHLIQPDATNDHVIWSEPVASGNSLDQSSWRPDSAEVAFVSNHEQLASLFQSDLYGVRPDGTGLRRITNPPDVSQLGGYPTGSVAVTISNVDLIDSGPFTVYMEGALQSQLTTVPAGTFRTLTFNNVAIFPNATQFPVVIYGLTRWIYPPSGVVLQAGQTVPSTVRISSNNSLESWGAFNPAWRTDGAQVDFAVGDVALGDSMPTNPSAGAEPTLLLTGSASASMFSLDRGPTPALANQVLYWDNINTIGGSGFYQVTEGSSTPPTTPVLATNLGEFVYNLQWLPDGSGFLFSKSDGLGQFSNVFEYDFASQLTTQITQFTSEYSGYVSVSPDASTIVFEHSLVDPNPVLNPNLAPDLWMMPRDGSAAPSLFVANGRYPSWSRTTPQVPPPLHPAVYLPAVFR